MSDFGQSLKLKYISEIRRFCEILWKDTGHFSPNNRTFLTFQNPDSQTWGSGYNSNTKQNTAIKHGKNRFQKCPKNHNCISSITLIEMVSLIFFCKWVLMGHLKKYFSAIFRLCV